MSKLLDLVREGSILKECDIFPVTFEDGKTYHWYQAEDGTIYLSPDVLKDVEELLREEWPTHFTSKEAS